MAANVRSLQAGQHPNGADAPIVSGHHVAAVGGSFGALDRHSKSAVPVRESDEECADRQMRVAGHIDRNCRLRANRSPDGDVEAARRPRARDVRIVACYPACEFPERS